MIKRLTVLIAFFLFTQSCFSQIQSPEQFLGYQPGTRFTPHHLIVDYFRHIANAAPDMVKLQQYGETYEKRPLVVAFISSASNISNLENIRNNNLRLARFASGNGNTAAPALVWLSYNVHGNEASSSEASMLTLYALVNPGNAQTKKWLENTVIIMDPCLNPDGRDRYVNWYNSVVGAQYNPSLAAREHREPWPGGRSNHYYFDLNRDWAWQTQTESRQRLQLYQQWYPQVHVDFHEQGINDPYYFAPAAEPFHEVITPWQRDFQKVIGLNHARYFDERGWLYFTKERFDLLYPSYGDTYPVYNGSIGMTYEQAGSGAAGLGVLMNTGDTLTLTDRALHHHTTGLSTIEAASQNAQRLVSEFGNYFRDAVAGSLNTYQSYVIKKTGSKNLDAFMQLLQKNNIQFFNGRPAMARGYNYHHTKEENFQVEATDIVVPAGQPAGALVKVLFDPNVKLSDTATYDITAWALPYVYGLRAYATKDKISHTPLQPAPAVNIPETNPYGYVFRWDGVNSVRLAADLLQAGIRIRFAEAPFTTGGQTFERGSVIVLKTGNQYQHDLWKLVRSQAIHHHVELVPVSTGFVEKGFDFGSSRVRSMKQKRVALMTGEGISSLGVGEVWFYLDQELKYPVTLINQNNWQRINWSDYDVVILPSGSYKFSTDKTMAEQLKTWISSGGTLIALEGAVNQLSKLDWAIKAKKSDEKDRDEDPYEALRRYEERERDAISDITPGSIFRVELDNSHPLAFGYPGYYYSLKQDDKIYEFIKESGWNVGVIRQNNQLSGFVGAKLQKKLEDGLLIGVQEIGRGNVVYFADDVLFRNFWENGKLLFSNAIFLVGQ